MKNLKKVLALVLSCAMIFSVVMTASAVSSYPDVAEDAVYAEAVQVLSALKIIQGDESGKFNPDQTITRAETAKILCTMVESGTLATTLTSFSDVPADHWASGYIQFAKGRGYIDGYDATTFGPEDPVTYEQILKLVLCAMGYKPAADYQGGYPTGYLILASTLKLTTNVPIVTSTGPAPRSAVAMVVCNAMNTPVMKQTSYGTTAQYTPMDGSDAANGVFQTLLTDMDCYKVTATIMGNAKSTISGPSDLKAGYVNLQISDYQKVDEDEFDGKNLNNIYAAGSGAEDLLGYVANVYLKRGDDERFSVICATAKKGKNVVYDIKDSDQVFDPNKDSDTRAADKFDLTNTTKRIYSFWNDRTKESRITALEVNENAYVLWNGEVIGQVKNLSVADLTPYDVGGNFLPDNRVVPKTGSVVLVDNNDDDGFQGIDLISCKSFGVGVVDDVDTNIDQLTLKTYAAPITAAVISLDTYVMSNLKEITMTMDGNAIELKDLKENDVLNISTDDYGFTDPKFLEIIVTRKSVEGSITEVGTNNDFVAVDGTRYDLLDGMGLSMRPGDEGIFFLDMNDNIVYSKASSIGDSYAYLHKLGDLGMDNWVARMYTYEGKAVDLSLATSMKINGVSKTNLSTAYTVADIKNMFGVTITATGANGTVKLSDVATGIVGYDAAQLLTPQTLLHALSRDTVNGMSAILDIDKLHLGHASDSNDVRASKMMTYQISNNTLKTVNLLTYADKLTDAEWDADLVAFDGDSLDKDAKIFVLDEENIDSYRVQGISYLRDGSEYSPYLFDNEDSDYKLVVMFSAGSSLLAEAGLSVFKGTSSIYDKETSNTYTNVIYYQGGVEKTIKSEDDTIADGMNAGDVFVLKTDSNNFADKIIKLWSMGTKESNFLSASPRYALNGGDDFLADIDLSDTDISSNWSVYDKSNVTRDSAVYFGLLADSETRDNGVSATLFTGSGLYSDRLTVLVPKDANVLKVVPSASHDSSTDNRFLKAAAANLLTKSSFTKSGNDFDFASFNKDTGLRNLYFVFFKTYEKKITDVVYINYVQTK